MTKQTRTQTEKNKPFSFIYDNNLSIKEKRELMKNILSSIFESEDLKQ